MSSVQKTAARSVQARASSVAAGYKQRKSLLIVTSGPEFRAARNLAGVDVVTVDQLNVEHLAPGMQAGRLTVWTESAVIRLEGR